MSQAKMGTFQWGKATDGVLSRSDKFALIRNLAFVQAREVSDVIRQKLRLLPVSDVSLDALQPPNTSLAKDALDFAQETHSQALLFHSWRTYYLGRLIAAQRGIDHNNEMFFYGRDFT
jgi:hypothetical protein